MQFWPICETSSTHSFFVSGWQVGSCLIAVWAVPENERTKSLQEWFNDVQWCSMMFNEAHEISWVFRRFGLTLPSLFACFRASYSSGLVPLKTTCTETRAINGTLGKLSYKSCWLLATKIYKHQIQILMDVEFKAFHTKCASYDFHLLIVVHEVVPVTELICVRIVKEYIYNIIYILYMYNIYYIYIYLTGNTGKNRFLFPGSLTFLGSIRGWNLLPLLQMWRFLHPLGNVPWALIRRIQSLYSAHLWTMRKFEERQSNESESYSSVKSNLEFYGILANPQEMQAIESNLTVDCLLWFISNKTLRKRADETWGSGIVKYDVPCDWRFQPHPTPPIPC